MTLSIYDSIIEMKKGSNEDMLGRLIGLGYDGIFSYVWENHQDSYKAIVLYAAHTYSWESDRIKIGQDWLKMKESNAEYVDLDKDLFEAVVHLKDEAMRNAFKDFFFLYQERRDFLHMIILKEAYQEACEACLVIPIKDGNNDMGAYLKNMHVLTELKDDVKKAEDAIREESRKMDQAKKELTVNNYSDMSIEGSGLIKNNKR